MNSDKREDYYVGLDMGTGSLGGAVTDTQYHLLKVKGKDFWFVREYETAKSQLDRRTHRIAKRRLQRHKARIGLIRSYFAEDILKHDPLFYIRQDNSKYYQEDKDARLQKTAFLQTWVMETKNIMMLKNTLQFFICGRHF